MEQERITRPAIDPAATHILVIDSDARQRRFSERILAAEGFAVTAVGEGLSAIRAALGCRFALAIAALDLPGMLDGMTTLHHLRHRQPAIRALFTGDAAAWPEPLDERDDFISAAMLPHELLGCVFELLQRRTSQLDAV